jgi:hypothetical protein
MARKPVDQLPPDERRDYLWAAIRRLKTFTARDLCYEGRLAKGSVQEYLQGLTNAGYLTTEELPSSTRIATLRYTLTNDPGAEAPRVRRDGSEVTQGRSREQLWRTMKILGEFSACDLAIHASTEDCLVAESEAKDYIFHLHRAGYLVLSRPHVKGRAGLSRYRMLPSKNTGPRPPQIQRVKQVYDPNLQQVVWTGKAGQ